MSAETLRRAIETWHGLLEDSALAADCAERMDEEHRRRGMFFGERPLCSVLRPRFLTPGQYRWICGQVAVLMSAFRRAHEAAMADPEVLAQFRLLDWEAELIEADPGFASPAPTSRLDAFFDPERQTLRFTEYNAETPAGPAYMDELSDAFLALPATGEFLRTHTMQPLPSRHGVLHALLRAYAEWGGHRELPSIGILDWSEVPTYSEFVFFRDYFRSHGIACEIADPRSLEYRGGRLMAGDFPITLIYKRVLIDELVLRMGIDNPVVRAVRDGAVCMVNPFRCKVLYKKASLAVLGDERNAHLFSDGERAAVEASIPFTRIVEERKTRFHGEQVDLLAVEARLPLLHDAGEGDGRLHRIVEERKTRFHGEEVDLLPWAEANRERLVLKPNDDYGGRGIVLGWLVSAEEWGEALKAALETPYVVQERIVLPKEPYPSWVDGRLEVYDRMVDIAPFVSHAAHVDGALTRIATDPLLNVTAGGGSSIATMLVEER